MSNTIVLLLCLLLLSISTIHGQQSTKPNPTSKDQLLTMNMRDADIRALIEWIAQTTNKNIIIDPRVKGKVTVLANEGITKEEAYEVFLSVLQVHGYAAVETEDAIKIIPDVNAKQINIPLINNDVDKTSKGLKNDLMVVRVIKVRNVSAIQLVSLLRPLIPQVGHLAAYPESNALIISDRASNIDRISRIIDSIDQAGDIDIEIIQLKHASAKDVIQVLNSLMPKPTGQAAILTSSINFSADDRSNSILISGDPTKRKQIRNLIRRLDKPLKGTGNTHVIYLHYQKAADLVPILQSVSGSIQKEQKEKNQAAANVEVTIQASEATNALIITAPPSLLSTMKQVIEQLDIRRAQVLVEAIIVEVSENLSKEMGIDLRTSASAVGEDGLFGGSTLSFGNINSFPGDPIALAEGFSLGFFRNGDIRALIRAMESDSTTNILSTPTIVTLDNEEAEILVGQNVPFVTGRRDNEDGGNPFTTIERQDVGVTLKIKPQINIGNAITLDVEQEVSSVSDSAVAEDIITNKRSIKTRVLIEDDQILVLGGLIEDQLLETDKKIPLLGRIPLIGKLFSNTKTTKLKTNLMVFIHPVILKDRQQVSEITNGRYNFMRDKQIHHKEETSTLFRPRNPPVLPEMEEVTQQKEK